MTIDAKTIDLVQKLHSLATNKGATEAEAQVALEKMQKILFEHNLELASVLNAIHKNPQDGIKADSANIGKVFDHGEKPDDFISRYATLSEREWHVRLADAVARYNFCATLSSNKFYGVTFVGTAANVKAVKEIWAYAAEQVQELSYKQMYAYRRAGGTEHGRTWRRQFCFGAVARITDRLWAQWDALKRATEASTALVIVNDKALAVKVKELSSDKPFRWGDQGHGDGYTAGFAAGATVDIGRPQRKLS